MLDNASPDFLSTATLFNLEQRTRVLKYHDHTCKTDGLGSDL